MTSFSFGRSRFETLGWGTAMRSLDVDAGFATCTDVRFPEELILRAPPGRLPVA